MIAYPGRAAHHEEMDSPDPSSRPTRYWFLQGVSAVISMPAFILLSAFVGFAGFARESGLSLGETAFMVPVIWALPSHVILVAGITSGASLLTIAIAVSLASARLMPMVMALMPEMRTASTPKWKIYALSHFIAVTAWVISMQRFRDVPHQMRTTFFLGFCLTVSFGCTIIAVIVFLLAATVPPVVAGALFFLTPIYFLTSLWATARMPSDKFAMIAGLILGPLFHQIWPELDILAAGLLGGAIAYFFHLAQKARRGRGRV